MNPGPVAVPQPPSPQSPVLLEAVAVLPVRELTQALAFYQALGFSIDSSYDDYAIVVSGDCWLHLRAAAAEFSGMPDGYNPAGAYVFVADVQALYAHCVAVGISTINEPEAKPWNVIEFAVGDSDGNLLRFGERIEGGA